MNEADGNSRPSVTAAVFFVVAVTLIHLIVAARASLVPDETYYWLWSRSLASGYVDHPPMVALWVAAGSRLFGDSALAIRLMTVLAFPVVSLLIYGTARTLFDNATIASRAVIWCNLTVLVSLGGFIAGPDSPSVVFWSAATFALAKTAKTDEPKWWLAVGLFAGLGAASKYTNLFFGVVVLLWLLADRRSRRWLLSPWPYFGGVVALLAFLPVLLWNVGHDWISLRYQFRRVTDGQLDFGGVGEFIGGQLLLANPFIAILAGAAVVYWVQRRRPATREVGFLIATIAPIVVYLIFHSFHARVEGNWPAPIYPAVALLAAVASGGALPRWLVFVRAAVLPFGLAVAVVGLGIVAMPPERLLARIGPKFVGWGELAAAVDEQLSANDARWVATTDYATTAELAYHLRPVAVNQINQRLRYLFQGDGGVPVGRAILVQRRSDDRDLSACFGVVRGTGTFQRRTSEAGSAYRLSVVEMPAADLLKNGCAGFEDRLSPSVRPAAVGDLH